MSDIFTDIDWFDNNYGTATALVNSYRIEASIDRGLDEQTGQIQVGTFQAKLRNDDGQFSPLYSASPLYPNVEVGKAARFRRLNTSGGTVELFNGAVREVTIETVSPNIFASLDSIDLTEKLRKTKITTPLYEGKTADQLISYILALTGYTGGSAFDTGAKTFAYASWRKASALEAIQEVVNSEMGQFYIDSRGTPTFHARYYRAITTTNEVSLSNVFSDFSFWHTTDDVYNIAEVTCYPRLVGGTATLWTWNEVPYYLQAGGTVILDAEFTDPTYSQNCEGKSVITPAGTTDYTANSASGGGGTNLTANITVSMTAYGQSANLSAVNGGTVGAYITLLKVRGLPVTKLNPVTMSVQNTVSQAAYDVYNTITLDQPLETSADSAYDAAQYLVTKFGTPIDRVRFSIQPADSARKDAMVNTELDDRVALTETISGLSSSPFFIDHVNHSVGDSDNSHVVTYSGSGASAYDLIILDSASQTFSDVLGY